MNLRLLTALVLAAAAAPALAGPHAAGWPAGSAKPAHLKFDDGLRGYARFTGVDHGAAARAGAALAGANGLPNLSAGAGGGSSGVGGGGGANLAAFHMNRFNSFAFARSLGYRPGTELDHTGIRLFGSTAVEAHGAAGAAGVLDNGARALEPQPGTADIEHLMSAAGPGAQPGR